MVSKPVWEYLKTPVDFNGRSVRERISKVSTKKVASDAKLLEVKEFRQEWPLAR